MEEYSNNQEKDVLSIKGIAILIAIIVILVWAATFLLFFVNNWEHRGQFGDMFGAVNSLFSGLAFAGLIITLILQKKELSLQRDELQMTREEMKNQRMEFEQENKTIRYQRFENHFYNMLNLQQRIVDGLKVEYETDVISEVPLSDGSKGYETRRVLRSVTGRDVFQYTFLSEEYKLKMTIGTIVTIDGFKDVLNRKGLKEYDDSIIPSRFDHYFRHLYKIIQFVDSQGFSFDEAYRYISFLRGTLSRYELVWLYYNALSPRHSKMKELIEKYTLLKSIRPEILTQTKETENYYNSLGLTKKEMIDNHFSSTDFDFYLTDGAESANKYLLSAFWKITEIEKAEQYYRAWCTFISSKTDNS